jgi:hypothetical protein
MPGVAFQWMEVEGPLIDSWPLASHRLLFGDLRVTNRVQARVTRRPTPIPPAAGVEVVPQIRARRREVARRFMRHAMRHPVRDVDLGRFLAVIRGAMRPATASRTR